MIVIFDRSDADDAREILVTEKRTAPDPGNRRRAAPFEEQEHAAERPAD
jgi:hypothetical protein